MSPQFLLTSVKSAITKAKISTPDCVHSETKTAVEQGRKSTSTDRAESVDASTSPQESQEKGKKL